MLLTGLSGTGKSTIIDRLAARGFNAIDLDSDEWSEWVKVQFEGDPASGDSPVEPDRDWMWREDRVQTLLSSTQPAMLFVAGCAPNMAKFCDRFDYIVLLSAPADAIAERLMTRDNNEYGKRPEELARVLAQIDAIEPRLRKLADFEIDTSVNVDEVVRRLLVIDQKRTFLGAKRNESRSQS